MHSWLRSQAGRIRLLIIPIAASLQMVGITDIKHLPGYSASTMNSVTWEGMAYIHPLSRLKEFCLGMLAAAGYIHMQKKLNALITKKMLMSCIEFLSVLVLFACFKMLSIPLYSTPFGVFPTNLFWLFFSLP